MKKNILVLLFCFLTLNRILASANKSPEEKRFSGVLGAFIVATDLNESEKARQEAENKLLIAFKKMPQFKEPIIKAYNFEMGVMKENNNIESIVELKRIGNKLGID